MMERGIARGAAALFNAPALFLKNRASVIQKNIFEVFDLLRASREFVGLQIANLSVSKDHGYAPRSVDIQRSNYFNQQKFLNPLNLYQGWGK